MFHKFVVILTVFVSEVKTLDSICFTWTLSRHELRFVCKVDHLKYDVAIMDKSGKEHASCQTPSNCFSYIPHGNIYQDVAKQTTILTVSQSNIDSSFQGNWTCRHGRGREKATAEIYVNLGDYTIYSQNYSLWTIIGFIPMFLLISTIQIIRRSVVKWFLGQICVVLYSFMPIILDFLVYRFPLSAKYFVVNGVILALMCNVTTNIDQIKKEKLKEIDCDASDEIGFQEQDQEAKETVT